MAELVVGESTASDAAEHIAGATIHLVRGVDQILRLQQVLAGLSARCGQPGVMNDIGYFLSKPGTLNRVPHLLLLSRGPVLDMATLTTDDLAGSCAFVPLQGAGLRDRNLYTRTTGLAEGRLVAPAALRLT